MSSSSPPTNIPQAPATFTVATWNVYHGTPATELEPLLQARLAKGVSIILFQELAQTAVRDMVRANGLRLVVQERQYGIAYLPDRWTEIASGGIRLSNMGYYGKERAPKVRYSDGAWAILADASGRTLTALSYHLPPHVQVDDPPPRRIQATRETMVSLRRLARTAKTHACLFGGDDNVDESRRFRERFRFMLREPLKQVVAPAPTHGRRRIDDFRITGLDALDGEVSPGGGDHRIHTRTLRWS